MKKLKEGFTLAEVLVTLAIIGVVAALTIPSLIQNTNSTKYTTALKKNLSVLNQALKTNLANNDMDARDPSIINGTRLAAWFVTGDALGVAGTTPSKNLNILKWTLADPSSVWLNDGTRLVFNRQGGGSGCQTDLATAFTPVGHCYVMVDTNGDRKPNKVAIDAGTGAADVWLLGINSDSVIPVILDAGSAGLPSYDINGVLLSVSSSAYSPAFVAIGNRASYAALTGAVVSAP